MIQIINHNFFEKAGKNAGFFYVFKFCKTVKKGINLKWKAFFICLPSQLRMINLFSIMQADDQLAEAIGKWQNH